MFSGEPGEQAMRVAREGGGAERRSGEEGIEASPAGVGRLLGDTTSFRAPPSRFYLGV